jgi:hypothetical protein
MYKYPDKVQTFIADNVSGRRTQELVDLVNSRLKTNFTVPKMRSYMKNHDLKNGLPTRVKGEGYSYPDHIRSFIMSNYIGTGHQAMADMLNKEFGTAYTKEQIKGCYARYKLDSGLTGRYIKGQESWNKGKPKSWVGGEETQFKKGSIPPNRLPIGSERIDSKGGYIYVKKQDGHLNKNWKQKHVFIWEEKNGPIPKGHCILFGDSDKRNFDIDNLICVSRKQLARLNQNGLIQKDTELTKTGIVIADIQSKIGEAKKRNKPSRRRD